MVPVEDGVIASDGVGDDVARDGETVLAVGKYDDGVAVVEINRDESFVVGIVAPVPEVFAGGGLLDAPAESPEDFSRKRCWGGAVGAIRAGGIDGDLRGFHLLESGGLEAAAVEDRFDEERVVVGVCEEAGGGVAVETLDGIARLEARRV